VAGRAEQREAIASIGGSARVERREQQLGQLRDAPGRGDQRTERIEAAARGPGRRHRLESYRGAPAVAVDVDCTLSKAPGAATDRERARVLRPERARAHRGRSGSESAHERGDRAVEARARAQALDAGEHGHRGHVQVERAHEVEQATRELGRGDEHELATPRRRQLRIERQTQRLAAQPLQAIGNGRAS
jgi:hypothetical protein